MSKLQNLREKYRLIEFDASNMYKKIVAPPLLLSAFIWELRRLIAISEFQNDHI